MYDYDDAIKYSSLVHIGKIYGEFILLNRIDPKSVPTGKFLYEVRHKKDHWGVPVEIGEYVMSDFYGSLITSVPLNLSRDGSLLISPEDFKYVKLK